MQIIRTPCVGVCSTGIGDSVCRGCQRFEHEVIDWNSYDQAQKRAIDKRLASLLAQLVERHLQIVDENLLLAQIAHQQIRIKAYRPAACALYDLLKAGASQIDDTLKFGFQRQWVYREQPLTAIRESIEDELYSLSVAHYERFVLANAARARLVTPEQADVGTDAVTGEPASQAELVE